jgi:hypothetical protein
VLNWVGSDSAGSHFDSLTSPNTGEALCGCRLSHIDKILPAAGAYTLLTIVVTSKHEFMPLLNLLKDNPSIHSQKAFRNIVTLWDDVSKIWRLHTVAAVKPEKKNDNAQLLPPYPTH